MVDLFNIETYSHTNIFVNAYLMLFKYKSREYDTLFIEMDGALFRTTKSTIKSHIQTNKQYFKKIQFYMLD